MMKIIALKLTSAEEIIGTVESENDEKYVLGKVRTLVMQQGPEGQIGLGILPYMPSANNVSDGTESDIEVYKTFVMSKPISTSKSLEDAYLKETSEIILN